MWYCVDDDGEERMTCGAEQTVLTVWFKWASCPRVDTLWKGSGIEAIQFALSDLVKRLPDTGASPRLPLGNEVCSSFWILVFSRRTST